MFAFTPVIRKLTRNLPFLSNYLHFDSLKRGGMVTCECTSASLPQPNSLRHFPTHYSEDANLLFGRSLVLLHLRRMSSTAPIQLDTHGDVVRFSFGTATEKPRKGGGIDRDVVRFRKETAKGGGDEGKVRGRASTKAELNQLSFGKVTERGGGTARDFGKGREKGGGDQPSENKPKRKKVSKKAKVNELRFYRLKAKRKMKSPNPETRIKYKLGKAKRKEEWLIQKLRKYEIPAGPVETHDPEILTEEERFYIKRIGDRKKHYVPVGRRGVFGGVVLNMHLHWKRHETVKVSVRPCKPGQIHDYAAELARLSHGIIIDIKPNNTILFYRGKNYVLPEVMSPPDTLSKAKSMEKYKFEQSLEHTSQFIERLEKELEEYRIHLERYKSKKKNEVTKEVVDG